MKHVFLLVLLATLDAGCARGPEPPRTQLSFPHFVTVVSELSAAQPHQRAEILKKHGTNEAEIREFVLAHAQAPQRLADAFDSVQVRIERTRSATP